VPRPVLAKIQESKLHGEKKEEGETMVARAGAMEKKVTRWAGVDKWSPLMLN